MSFVPKIHILSHSIEEKLSTFTNQAKKNDDAVWRCLYAPVSQQLDSNPNSKNIVLKFLMDSFFKPDEVEVFWLTKGHLFIFFQGHVRSILKAYEAFLDQISEDENNDNKPEYHFFWEIEHFWGFYDEILGPVINQDDAQEINTTQDARDNRDRPLILIMDDDRTTRHFLQAMLKDYGDILIAWNAAQAEKIYKRLLPNIAFLDIMVPFGDGDDLAEKLCTYDPYAFIVMVSGALTPSNMKACEEAGVKGFIKKPPEQQDLISYVAQYHKEREERHIPLQITQHSK